MTFIKDNKKITLKTKKTMKNLKLFLIMSLTILIASCGNNENAEQNIKVSEPLRQQYISQIKDLEKELYKSTEINNATANLAIKAYDDFVIIFPTDSLAPHYLFKAGEIATATKKYKQALERYQNITKKYPDYKYFRESLYLQAFLLDNFLNDDAGAKVIYEEIIAKYPATNYARDSKAAIDNLGKTDEQLIEEFKKKNDKK